MLPLLVGRGRTVDRDPQVDTLGAHERARPEQGRERLRRRRATEREQPQGPVAGRRPSTCPELRHVDAVADPEHLRILDRIRAAVDAEPDVGEHRRELQRPVDRPVRVPERERHPHDLGERRGQHEVDRAHVRDHRVRPRPPQQLRHERAHVAQAAAELRPRAERAQRAVGRQVVRADAVRDHDQLVAALRERPQLRDGGTQNRVVRVDGLGHEDEAHQRRASDSVRSTSERTRAA